MAILPLISIKKSKLQLIKQLLNIKIYFLIKIIKKYIKNPQKKLKLEVFFLKGINRSVRSEPVDPDKYIQNNENMWSIY